MPLSRARTFLVLALAVCLVSAGCARTPKRTPMRAFSPPPAAFSGTQPGFYHTLERGQTIYRVAKNYEMDWRELMRINRITDPNHLEVGQRLFIPQTPKPSLAAPLPGVISPQEIRRIVGPPRARSDWRTITVHHSGTKKGGAKAFHRDHTRRRMGGLFYHFVIGNGTNTGDGALEVGFRWQRQTEANRRYDIQVCLVGDFNEQYVSESQFSTLAALVRILREDYGISIGGIRKHEDIKGKHTACPGRHFPFDRLLAALSP